VAQTAVVARQLGAVDVPETVAELHELLESYRPELRPTPAALEAAHFLLRKPPLPAAMLPAYGLITSAGVALLPRWARRPLGLFDAPTLERAAVRPLGRFVTGTIRWALDSVPPAQPPGPLVLTPPPSGVRTGG
jgi:uncharacterized protein (DUF2236 family)